MLAVFQCFAHSSAAVHTHAKSPSTSKKSSVLTSLLTVQSHMPNRNFVITTATLVTVIFCFHNSALSCLSWLGYVKLAIRYREHIGGTKTGYRINNNSSAGYNHSSTIGYPVSSEDFRIICSVSTSIELLIHESLLILSDRATLNSQTSIQLTFF